MDLFLKFLNSESFTSYNIFWKGSQNLYQRNQFKTLHVFVKPVSFHKPKKKGPFSFGGGGGGPWVKCFFWREQGSLYYQPKQSGQISIIPKPELRGFWVDSLPKPPFKVTSAEVVIICPEQCTIKGEIPQNHHKFWYHLIPPNGSHLMTPGEDPPRAPSHHHNRGLWEGRHQFAGHVKDQDYNIPAGYKETSVFFRSGSFEDLSSWCVFWKRIDRSKWLNVKNTSQ